MALFQRKQQAGEKGEKRGSPATAPQAPSRGYVSSVLLRPRITEKAARQSEQGAYVFEIGRDAGKRDVRDAVREIFKVTPRKVTIVNRAPRRAHSRARGRSVVVHGLKKANVFLKKGERIDLA